jgi:hypothetical protein
MTRTQKRMMAMAAAVWAALSFVTFPALAADPIKLESIDVQTLPGQQVQLKLHLSGPAPEPTAIPSSSRSVPRPPNRRTRPHSPAPVPARR